MGCAGNVFPAFLPFPTATRRFLCALCSKQECKRQLGVGEGVFPTDYLAFGLMGLILGEIGQGLCGLMQVRRFHLFGCTSLEGLWLLQLCRIYTLIGYILGRCYSFLNDDQRGSLFCYPHLPDLTIRHMIWPIQIRSHLTLLYLILHYLLFHCFTLSLGWEFDENSDWDMNC